tara:strand:+ start:18 stop:128 length:111 start_codon:yes stop_codon:yes gene_type:complete
LVAVAAVAQVLLGQMVVIAAAATVAPVWPLQLLAEA